MAQPINPDWPADHAQRMHGLTMNADDLAPFPADMLVMVSSGYAYQFASGHRGRTLTCAVCDELIGDQPATLHAIITPDKCQSGGNHLCSATAAIHLACESDNAELLTHAVARAVYSCDSN